MNKKDVELYNKLENLKENCIRNNGNKETLNKIKERIANLRYRVKNREKLRGLAKEHYEKNKENRKSQMRDYYQNNKDKLKQYFRDYQKKNKDKVNEYMRKWRKKKLKKQKLIEKTNIKLAKMSREISKLDNQIDNQNNHQSD